MISISRNNLVYAFCVLLFLSVIAVNAQSTNSDYPTAVTANEIKGIIKARDVGDSRSTRYFYKFTGTPGDLNLIIESENLNGDVDVFTLNGLRPLTKVSFFDTGSKFVATSAVFLRKREVLLLRVEAKSASENPGNFRIQFSGGFEPIADAVGSKETAEPTLPKTKTAEGTYKVNSVGARIEEPKPPVKETPATTKTETAATTKTNAKTPSIKTPAKGATPSKTPPTAQPKTTGTSKTTADANTSSTKKETVAERRKRLRDEAAARAAEERRKREEAKAAEEQRRREAAAKANADKARKESENNNNTTNNAAVSKPTTAASTAKTKPSANTKAKEPAPPDPMASVRLVVETKDGQKIERMMNEVRRVNVEKGVLVIVFMDGKTERIPMTNVQKMAIEPMF